MTKLAGSGVMLVFLRDSVEVLSRPVGSEATSKMKLKLWGSYDLCTNIPLIPNQNNYVDLAWNVYQSTKSLEYDTRYNQASVETKINWELNNTSGGGRVDFHEKGPFKELDFYQRVAKCLAATTTLQKFFLASFWSLPIDHPQ